MDILQAWIGSEVCATRLSDRKDVRGTLDAVDEDGIIVKITGYGREEFVPKHNLKCIERQTGKEGEAVVSEGIGCTEERSGALLMGGMR